MSESDEVYAERARDWQRRLQEDVCDVVTPWDRGVVLRASPYPHYWKYNVVRVDGDPRMSCEELIAFADEQLGDLDHRRIDFEAIEPADRLRADFERAGWRASRLVWMRHELAPALVSSHAVDAVDYDSVRDLRLAWHYEDFPGSEPGEFIDNQQEIAGRRSARVLAVVERGAPMGFAQLECAQDAAEISEVYVLPEHRGRGIGTSVTLGAIAAAPDVENLWILADDEDRPKELYARLGFRPIWKTMEFLRVPRRLG